MDFDRSSRHILTAEIVRKLIEPPGPLLEVGGSQGLTRDLLPNYKVVVTDVSGDDTEVVASGHRLPFADGGFAVVIALDVLEHVPASMRPLMLAEFDRVATDALIIAGPFDSPEIRGAERHVAAVYRNLSGKGHRWLQEHADYGLPALDVVLDGLGEMGFVSVCLPTNPLEMWNRLQLLNFAAAESDHAGMSARVHESLTERFLGGGDQEGTPYRHLILATRHLDPNVVMQDVRASLEGAGARWDVDDALRSIDLGVASVIRETTLSVQELRRGVERKSQEARELHQIVSDERYEGRQLRQRVEEHAASIEALQRELTVAAERADSDGAELNKLRAERTEQGERAKATAAEVDRLERARVEAESSARVQADARRVAEVKDRMARLRIRVQASDTVAREHRQVLDDMTHLVRSVTSDLERFERSKRWRMGVAIGRLVPRLRGSQPALPRMKESLKNIDAVARDLLLTSKATAVRRRDLDRSLKKAHAQGDGSHLADLQQAVTVLDGRYDSTDVALLAAAKPLKRLAGDATRLEASRRWRVGKALGDILKPWRAHSADLALPRLRHALEEFSLAPSVAARVRRNQANGHASQPSLSDPANGGAETRVAPRERGYSAALDAAMDQAAYDTYIENIEPSVLAAVAIAGRPATVHTILLAPPSDLTATNAAIRIHDTFVSAAPLGPVTIRWPDDDVVAIPVDDRLRHVEGKRPWQSVLEDAASTADFVMIVDAGDRVREELPHVLGSTRRSDGFPPAVLFDDDVIGSDNRRRFPRFKPSLSPDWLIEHDYVGAAVAFASSELAQTDLQGLDPHEVRRDLLFRMWEAGRNAVRVEAVLLHQHPGPRTRTGGNEVDFVEAITERIGGGSMATVERVGSGARVTYAATDEPLVSIIIPFKDKPELLETAIDSIVRLTTYPNYEIVLVDNDSGEPATQVLLAELSQRDSVQVMELPGPFNYSRANNEGARLARGDVLVFLNNDTKVLSSGWLGAMVGRAMRPDIGAVGAHLFYADGSFQHAGVVVGMRGFASHLFAGEHAPFMPQSWIRHAREVSAVTAACMAVQRTKFSAVEGFDEAFTLTGNDVDFCLRLLAHGYRNVVEPAARLFHFEKQSRADIPVPRNDEFLSFSRYQPHLANGDPYFNSNLSRWSRRLEPRAAVEPGIEQLRQRLFGSRADTTPEFGFLRRYDASETDLAENDLVMGRFRAEPWDVALRSATWFIPHVGHVYRGGIYTIFRFAEHFSRNAGTLNRIVLCGQESGDIEEMKAQVRDAFPAMKFEMDLLRPGESPGRLPPSDVGICTLWTTAYDLLMYNQCGAKFYFVQDYEPGFAPANALYGLIEQTYRFGFIGLANTAGVGDAYAAYGNEAMHFVPAVDTALFQPGRDVSAPTDKPVRVVFYGRPTNPRNGFELGLQALTELKTRYGQRVEIVSAGGVFDPGRYGVENVIRNLGVLPDIESVAAEYAKSDIGLVFMFTKHPSYQPLEYMASGCATVTNYNESNLWLLEHGKNALLAPPTVSGVADALSLLVEDSALRASIVEGGLATTGNMRWEPQLDAVLRYIETGRA